MNRKCFVLAGTLLCSLLLLIPVQAQEAPDSRIDHLARGINLSGWFWYGPENLSEVENHFTAADFAVIHDLGFTYVRLPVDLGFVWDSANNQFKEDALAVFDRGLEGLLAYDLAVVVDLHSVDQTYYDNIFSGRLEDDPAFIATFEAFWRAFAAHLSTTDPEMVFLEVLNEPVYQDDPALWLPVQDRLVKAIRENAPDHTIIVTSAWWSNLNTFVELQPLDDPNLIYNFHFYEPFVFTHQLYEPSASTDPDADWVEDVMYLRDIPYPMTPENVEPAAQMLDAQFPAGSDLDWMGSWVREYGAARWDGAKIDEQIQRAAAWGEQYGVPVMCNEFGAYARYAAPEDRAAFLRDMRTALEKYGISWAMWDYDDANSFGIVWRENGHPIVDPLTADALGLTTEAVSGVLPAGYTWEPVFRDDFEGDSLDTARWNTCYPWEEDGCTNEGNNELEWYQADDVRVYDGMLHLVGEDRSMNGFPYTSGMVTSFEKFDFQYGYVEVSARMPAGQGLWPAVWMMPGDGSWPPEIDILEVLGHEPNIVYMSNHTMIGETLVSASDNYTGPNLAEGFHLYGLWWTPDYLAWYVDGVERFRVEENVPQVPMYLLANLAIGGNWPGWPDENTVFPTSFDIDYMAVWQTAE